MMKKTTSRDERHIVTDAAAGAVDRSIQFHVHHRLFDHANSAAAAAFIYAPDSPLQIFPLLI